MYSSGSGGWVTRFTTNAITATTAATMATVAPRKCWAKNGHLSFIGSSRNVCHFDCLA